MWLRTMGPVGIFSIAYTAVAIVTSSRNSNSEFLIYIGVLIVLFGLVGWLHWRVHLTTLTLWCLSIWGFMHMAGGLVAVPASWPIDGDIRVLYSWWIVPGYFKYDNAVHVYGFGITTWACWQGLCAAMRDRGPTQPSGGLLLLCAAAGMGFGAMNEVIEFAATLAVPETNVGGYVNTGWDLVSNLAGCTIAALGIRLAHRLRRSDVT